MRGRAVRAIILPRHCPREPYGKQREQREVEKGRVEPKVDGNRGERQENRYANHRVQAVLDVGHDDDACRKTEHARDDNHRRGKGNCRRQNQRQRDAERERDENRERVVGGNPFGEFKLHISI